MVLFVLEWWLKKNDFYFGYWLCVFLNFNNTMNSLIATLIILLLMAVSFMVLLIRDPFLLRKTGTFYKVLYICVSFIWVYVTTPLAIRHAVKEERNRNDERKEDVHGDLNTLRDDVQQEFGIDIDAIKNLFAIAQLYLQPTGDKSDDKSDESDDKSGDNSDDESGDESGDKSGESGRSISDLRKQADDLHKKVTPLREQAASLHKRADDCLCKQAASYCDLHEQATILREQADALHKRAKALMREHWRTYTIQGDRRAYQWKAKRACPPHLCT